MSKLTEKHFVTFFSPGTFVSEQRQQEIDSWDVKKATKMSSTIKERYNAVPYGFRFSTKLVSEPISNGRGGEMKVESKLLKESNMYFINGRHLTLEQVKREMPFSKGDQIVDSEGNIDE